MRRLASLIGIAVAAVGIAAPPALAAPASVTLRSDPARAKIVPGAGEAVVVALLDDPDHLPGTILFRLYDWDKRTLFVPPKGDKRSYGFQLSFAKVGGVAQDVAAFVGVIPAGDYVLAGHYSGEPKVDSFCFGAPVMHVAAGSVSFVGGFRLYAGKVFAEESQRSAVAWQGDIERARAALVGFPSLRTGLVMAPISNGATFDCSGDNMWAYSVPGAPLIQSVAAP